MKLVDYLDGLVVMKSLSGTDWNYWEKENTSKLISYFIETYGIGITLIKLKNEDMTVASIYFHNIKHEAVEKIKLWMKMNPQMQKTYSDSMQKINHAQKAWKVTVGLENVEKLREFFDKTF